MLKGILRMISEIRNILSNFIDDKSVVSAITGPKTEIYWTRAFTHYSVNATENYEKLEFLGDASVNYAFILYIRENLKITSRGTSNNLWAYYTSKYYLPIMCKNIGLDKLLKTTVPVENSMLEDIFEAFFGVIEILLRRLYLSNPKRVKKPIDYIQNFMIWYFGPNGLDSIDIRKGDIPYKNYFNNYYHLFSNESSQNKFRAGYDPKSQTFKIGPNFLKGVRLYSEDLYNDLKAILSKKGESEQFYYSNAVEALKDNGFDLEWYERENMLTKFEDKDIKDALKSNGYTRAILVKNSRGSFDLLLQSVGQINRESISKLMFSFDTDDFNFIKEKSKELLRKKLGLI
jgi:hypothetical protein